MKLSASFWRETERRYTSRVLVAVAALEREHETYSRLPYVSIYMLEPLAAAVACFNVARFAEQMAREPETLPYEAAVKRLAALERDAEQAWLDCPAIIKAPDVTVTEDDGEPQ